MQQRRFGRKVIVPSTIEIKHQILLAWLADQTRLEADEASATAATLGAGALASQ